MANANPRTRTGLRLLLLLFLISATGCGLPGHGEWILLFGGLFIVAAIGAVIFGLVKFFDRRYERRDD